MESRKIFNVKIWIMFAILIGNVALNVASERWIYAETPYEILGVGKGAGSEDIKKAYHKLSRELHPDRFELALRGVTDDYKKRLQAKLTEQGQDRDWEKRPLSDWEFSQEIKKFSDMERAYNAEYEARKQKIEERFKMLHSAYDVLMAEEIMTQPTVSRSSKPKTELSDEEKMIFINACKKNNAIKVTNFIQENRELIKQSLINSGFLESIVNGAHLVFDVLLPLIKVDHLGKPIAALETLKKFLMTSSQQKVAAQTYFDAQGQYANDKWGLAHFIAAFGSATMMKNYLDKVEDMRRRPYANIGTDYLFSAEHHMTPHMIAVLFSNRGTLKILRDIRYVGDFVNAKNKYGETALTLAAKMASDGTYGMSSPNREVLVGIIGDLIASLADVNIVDSQGNTPLTLILDTGNAELINLLNDRGVGINYVDSAQNTPLIKAIVSTSKDPKNIEVVKKLLIHGANVNYMTWRKGPPLFHATCLPMNKSTQLEIVDLLIAKKAQINVHGESKMTPLMCAAAARNEELVKKLLGYGADVFAVDEHSENALNYARRAKAIDVIKLLEETMSERLINQLGVLHNDLAALLNVF